jgi:hypothetical protein
MHFSSSEDGFKNDVNSLKKNAIGSKEKRLLDASSKQSNYLRPFTDDSSDSSNYE